MMVLTIDEDFMHQRPTLSLIVPTRSRPAQLRQFLDSVAATARHPERIEIVLVVDDDDTASLNVRDPRLLIRQVVVPPGRTMGALNSAGYEASVGAYIMLLNDDVVIRTRGWDAIALGCFRRFPDPFVLVHVNDTLIKDYLCTFPLVSRAFCELAGGICPKEYRRYRIDDHIEDAFNLMAVFGERRTVYLPDVVFEHANAVEHPIAGRVYASDPEILAKDAPLFEALFPARKVLASRLLDRIRGGGPAEKAERREKLDAIADPFALRIKGRQHVLRTSWRKQFLEWAGYFVGFWVRAWTCFRRRGFRGLIGAVRRKWLGWR